MCRLVVGLVVLCVVSCVKPSAVECGDGRVCPDGYTCIATGCLSPAQIAACSGVADGEECTLELGPGTCLSGGCFLQVCGNGIVEGDELCDDGNDINDDACNNTCSGECGNGTLDPGEVCDDGNAVAGDGCSAGCLSDETCGNGIVDYAAGEQCDDGNTRNRDGCSGRCSVEAQIWQQLPASGVPTARRHAAAALDIGRGRTIMFGGADDGGFYNDTWEFVGGSNTSDAGNWRRIAPTLAPPPRGGHAVAFDSRRGRLVMFGGSDDVTLFDDTWEFDGVAWTKISTTTRPPARLAHALAYDSARRRIVLFGGEGASGRLDDTWEYDGEAWLQQSPAQRPSARHGHAVHYNPARGVTVLFGGATTPPFDPDNATAQTLLQDTWEYDGTTWTPRTLSGTPPVAREGHGMAWNAVSNVIVVHGGHAYNGLSGNTVLNDTWIINGSTWIEDTRGTKPAGRYQHVVTFDGPRSRLLVFGGAALATELGDTHEFTSSGVWLPWAPPGVPGARGLGAVAYDTSRSRPMLYGGVNPNGRVNETLELISGVWRPPFYAPTPNVSSARFGHAMAYDAARDRFVMFGGSTATNGAVDDTYLYYTFDWNLQTLAAKPTPRIGHVMAYDSARARVVLFGGGASIFSATDETWEWTGTSWTPITTATSPPPRLFAAMTYDMVRRRMVLFGGTANNSVTYNDTWEYDGSNWVQATPTEKPTPRFQHAMAFDADSGRVILFGGNVATTEQADTWEFDGTTWKQYVPLSSSSAAPPARAGAFMVYEPQLRRVVMFGGYYNSGGNTYLNDTWMYGYAEQETSEACSSGIDTDLDGAVGCDDDDCWNVCTPQCPPSADPAMCPSTPRCGDGVCSGDQFLVSDAVENCRSCPEDCTCIVRCGDGLCDAAMSETIATCPGDCAP